MMMLQVLSNGSLAVSEVYMEDSGMYGCTAKNGGGSERAELHLHVTSISTFDHWRTGTTGQFLPRDASAERGDATVSRPSVCPSVRPSVTFRYQQHIGCNSSKIISRPNSLRPLLWLTPNMDDLVQREHPKIRVE